MSLLAISPASLIACSDLVLLSAPAGVEHIAVAVERVVEISKVSGTDTPTHVHGRVVDGTSMRTIQKSKMYNNGLS